MVGQKVFYIKVEKSEHVEYLKDFLEDNSIEYFEHDAIADHELVANNK